MKLKWKMYKKYFGKCRMNSISQVEYFSGSTLVRVSSQFAVESAIMLENTACFKLAYSSLLLQPLLLQRLGFCGESPEASELLQSFTAVESGNLLHILSLFYKSNSLEILAAISTKDWSAHQKSACEATASSISGLHFSHYKAQASDETLTAIRCSIINLSIKNGTPLQRWINDLSVMLEKALGKTYVTKL